MADTLQVKGWWSNTNALSARPAGALSVAENVEIRALDELSPARGQAPQAGNYPGSSSSRFSTGTVYAGVNFEHHTGNRLVKEAGGVFTDVASGLTPPTGFRMRFAEAGDDLYLTTDAGVKVVDGDAGTPGAPGVRRSPDIIQIGRVTGSGWLADGFIVGYRTVFGRNDGEGKPVLGAPSGRRIIDTGAIATTEVNVHIPADIPAGYFLQVYRTAQVAVGFDPGDDMRLVYEAPITSAHVSAGFVLVEDETPDVARGPALYTNAQQEGINQANNQPPLVSDIAAFRQCLIGANITRAHASIIRLLSPLTVGETITIAGRTYTAQVGADYAAREFATVTSGSVAYNIEATAISLVNAITKDPSGAPVEAVYASGGSDAPGIISLQGLTLTATAFTISSTEGNKFIPDVTVAVSSVSDRLKNGLAISKPGLPYAFPSASYHTMRVGSAETEILRIVALKESVWVFKDGDGTWRLTGYGPGEFRADPVGDQVQLLAPDSVAVVGGVGYALTNKGVIAFSDNGIEVVDVAIENVIRSLINTPAKRATVRATAVGVGYEVDTEQKYILYLPEAAGDTYATQAVVFNTAPEILGWTRRVDELGLATGAYVNASGKLVQGYPFGPTTTVERKLGTASDYLSLYGSSVTVFGGSVGNRFTTDSLDSLQVGYVFVDVLGNVIARVVAIGDFDAGEQWFDVDDGDALRTSAGGPGDFTALFFEPLHIRFGWTVDARAPNNPKLFQEQTLQLDEPHTQPWVVSWESDLGATASSEAYPEGRNYLYQWVDNDVSYTTRLGTVWSYAVPAEEVTVLGMTSTMIVYREGSPEW